MTNRKARIAGLFVVFSSLAGVSMATPIVDDESTGAAKWTVTINVYIPRDPKQNDPDFPRSRHEELQQAVQEWQTVATGAGAGLTINPVVLDPSGNIPGTNKPPDPETKGNVIVEWNPDPANAGEAFPVFEGEPTGKKTADGQDILKDQELLHGKITIESGTRRDPAIDKREALALMRHEMGHMLGMDHNNEKDSVLQFNLAQYVDLAKIGDSDSRELKSIYVASNSNLEGSFLPLNDGRFKYSYMATWLSGGEIPLVQVVTLGAPIESPETPLGWELVGFPFTTPRDILSFRVAPTDDLQAYLNQNNSVLNFAFISSNPPATTLGWAGTLQDTVGPSGVIPEPSSMTLFATGIVGLLGYGWRRRNREKVKLLRSKRNQP